MNGLPDLIGAVTDLLLSKQVDGASKAVEVLVKLQQKRLIEARDILVEELQSGEKLPAQIASEDDLVSVLYRYFRAAQEGTARTNLRMMARLIRGKPAARPIYADQFLRYAALIEGLTTEEILILATAYRHMKLGQSKGNELHVARVELEEAGLLSSGRFFLYSQALQRTGLVTFSAIALGSISNVTELLSEFGALAELEAIDPAELKS